jgi:hypothetical protein
LLGEPCSSEGLNCLCSMVTMATKLLTVSLCRESRRISSSQNFLSSVFLQNVRFLTRQLLLPEFLLFRSLVTNFMRRVASSVQCLTTDWTTGRSRLDPWQRQKDFSSNLCVQTGSGAHPASCTTGSGGLFPGAKAWPGRDAGHSPHLVPRSRTCRSYTFSPPKRLRGV